MPSENPLYDLARRFARRLAEHGYMVITGAGGGIMRAANEGAGRENSFGVNILLPFEQEPNPAIADDPKLIHFKYFFTRKLFFVRESHACAVFPGGFGTHDELFEILTLLQTGKNNPHPIVLVDLPGGTYWRGWGGVLREKMVAAPQSAGGGVGVFPGGSSGGGGVGGVQGVFSEY